MPNPKAIGLLVPGQSEISPDGQFVVGDNTAGDGTLVLH